MPHVEKRGARKFLAVWKAPDGRRRSKQFERKIDADRYLATVTVDVLAGRYVDPNAGRVTFGAYAADWVAQRPVRESTRTRYAGYLAHMRELDPVPLAAVSRAAVRAWQTALSQRVAKSTARTIRGVAASIMRDAVLDRLVASSPFDGVKAPPRPDRVIVEPIPLDVVFALHDAITPRLAAALTLGQGAGLRRGEAFGLTVDRVDFLRRTIKIDRQLLGARDGRPIFGPPKTEASNAVVPVASSVLDELAAHLSRYPAGPDGLIFTTARGLPVTRQKVGEAWRDAEVRVWARATGHELARDGWRIPAATLDAWELAHPDGHGRRFHDLRHVFASELIRGGASVVVVQRLMRHRDASETLHTYSHMWPSDDDTARAIVDAMLAREQLESNQDDAGTTTGQ